MKSLRLVSLLLTLIVIPAAPGSPLAEPEWPQWRGPERNGISRETGLLKSWPANGPAMIWSISNLGNGYGSLAIKGDRILVQGVQSGSSVVFCLNRADGKPVWTATLGRSLNQDKGRGPRGTPTIDNDRVYALSENGDLACLKFGDGSVVWRKNILKEYGGSNPNWLISESPLVDGDRLVVTPGGNQAGIVAMDKMTGKTVWTTKELSDDAGYASCIAVDVQGVHTIIGFTARAGVGVRAADGKLMWRYEPPANRTANCATPVFADNKVFYTSDYGTGCGLLELKAQNGEVKAEELYFSRDMKNHHGGVVLVNGYLYGYSDSTLTCVSFATGRTVWRDRSVGKGSLTYADGNLYLLGEDNVVGLAEATPQGYREKGRFQIADQGLPSWAHPVVCGGRLYVRNQGMLMCYDVKAKVTP
ncbi:MAG TPA: PQQ-binding-like beta-propeller repeat protein [Blastocatellia bacterium]|nr:PQQ-binding-like beta-propeller repeat protein [Blastocatellia bacterium]